jgi:hypothetical protein
MEALAVGVSFMARTQVLVNAPMKPNLTPVFLAHRLCIVQLPKLNYAAHVDLVECCQRRSRAL